MADNKQSFSIPEKTVSWLLTSQTPSIRYLALTAIIRKTADDPLVLSTRAEIEKTRYIKAIFKDQSEEGYWFTARHYYSPKYRSTHWSMYLLTELGISPAHRGMQKGADFMLWRMGTDENSTEGHAALSHYQEDQTGFSCFWGNWLRYQIYCGNLSHPSVQQVIDFVCKDIHRDSSCPYNAGLPCAWGVIRSLHGLAIIPVKKRTEEIRTAIDDGIAFILGENGNQLISGSYPSPGKVHATWKQLSFPLFYHTDILFTLRVLSELDALSHPGAQKALDVLASKQKNDGTWRGASPFKSRSHPFLSPPDTPSQWVTLHALSILTAANRQLTE